MPERNEPKYFGSEKHILEQMRQTIVDARYTEELIGSVNGINAKFRTTFQFIQDTLQVYDDGLAQSPETDFVVISDMQIVFLIPPAAGSKVTASYMIA